MELILTLTLTLDLQPQDFLTVGTIVGVVLPVVRGILLRIDERACGQCNLPGSFPRQVLSGRDQYLLGNELDEHLR